MTKSVQQEMYQSRNQQLLATESLSHNTHASSDFILCTSSQDVLEAYQRLVNPMPKGDQKVISRGRKF